MDVIAVPEWQQYVILHLSLKQKCGNEMVESTISIGENRKKNKFLASLIKPHNAKRCLTRISDFHKWLKLASLAQNICSL